MPDPAGTSKHVRMDPLGLGGLFERRPGLAKVVRNMAWLSVDQVLRMGFGHASAFLAARLTLEPGRSLVHNIGNDSSGTHADATGSHDVDLSSTPIDLREVPVAASREAQAAFEAFFRRSAGTVLQRTLRRARQTVARITG